MQPSHQKIRHAIATLGRTRLVALITLTATVLAVLDVYLVSIAFNLQTNSDAYLRATIIPLLITPFLSWYLVGVFMSLDRLERQMSILATYDELTGLLNRRAFLKKGQHLHSTAIQSKQDYSVISIDLDFFKKINDDHGHAAGDSVLIQFSDLCKDLVRKQDIVSRFGGEEFIFFLPETSSDEALIFTQTLREKIKSEKTTHQDLEIEYTVSVGIAVRSHADIDTLEEIIQKSDKALYAAKRSGRDKAVIHPLTT